MKVTLELTPAQRRALLVLAEEFADGSDMQQHFARVLWENASERRAAQRACEILADAVRPSETTRQPRPPRNRHGCKPDNDVCIAHDQPLECRHGCRDAEPHDCPRTTGSPK